MVEKVIKMINSSSKIVVICGQDVADISGFPNIRSLTNKHKDRNYAEILCRNFLMNNADEFYDFYREVILNREYKPNIVHKFIAKLQKAKDITVITENVDGLQKEAGTIKLIELHGNAKRCYCTNCCEGYSSKSILYSSGTPQCICGGIIRPSVVLNGESVNGNELMKAMIAIQEADLLLICGNELTMKSTSFLLDFFKGECVVQINKSNINLGKYRSVSLIGDITESISKVDEYFNKV